MTIIACNLPSAVPQADTQATNVALTLTAMQSGVSQPPADTSTPVFFPTETSLPSVTPTPQNPLVLRATLCWVGPGPVYDVVSALKQNERVVLLGRGSNGGWWIVENPIYHDPCWVQEADLQLDPGTNTAGLKVFTPPPTPTPTSTPKPPTKTPTPTNTP